MRFLGNYIVSGRIQAILVISFFTIISLLLPPLAYLVSGVPVGLVGLRRGPVIGLQVVLGSLLLTMLLAYIISINQTIAPAFAVAIWIPVWVCSYVLRLTQSHGLLVLTAGGFGVLFIIIMYQVLGDVTAWWSDWLNTWLAMNLPAESVEQYRELFLQAMPIMNAMMASAIVVSLVLTCLIARWWQSALFNPGGFRAEFYKLRLPHWLVYPTLFLVILLLAGDEEYMPVLRDFLIIVIFMYLFQGVSTVHRIVGSRKLSQGWLVAMYGLLFILPQMVLFISCIGMADAWLGGRFRNNDNSSGDNQS